jgi:hypothetical protein
MTPTEVLNEIRKMPQADKRVVFRALDEQLTNGSQMATESLGRWAD